MFKAYVKVTICAIIVGVVTALLLAPALVAVTENPDGPLTLLPAVILLAGLLVGAVFVAVRRK